MALAKVIKPMLAQAVTANQLYKIRYPAIVQVKLDGVRGICYDGRLMSRSGKDIPNRHIQKFFRDLQAEHPKVMGLDGELIVGEANHPQACTITTSATMRHDGQPDFTYYVFDKISPDKFYLQRRLELMRVLDSLPEGYSNKIKLVGDYEVTNAQDLEIRMKEFLAGGMEGCIIRGRDSPYKHGRSTFKQGYLLKWKDIQEDEAIIVGFVPLKRNLNPAQINELGYTKRSSHKEGKITDGLLGALVVRSVNWQGTFNIGTGFDMDTRYCIWHNQDSYLHGIVNFKFLAAGVKDLPRHPVFLGMRDATDMQSSKLASLYKAAGIGA